jgi:shikimate kinase
VSRSIVLFGMMAVGKSTVARRVGARLGRDVLDTDDEVEHLAGTSILGVFAEHGEERFRELEREAVRQVAERDDAVVAVGGGAVLDDRNVAALRRHSVLVHLTVPPEVLNARLATSTATDSRPLLTGQDLRRTIDLLLAERGPRYTEVADHEVDADASPAAVAARVLAAIGDDQRTLTGDERERVSLPRPERGAGR